ncbi:MAG: 3-oxoadipyl-CoA thiolase [Pseudomonadota bacterium]
MTDAYICDAVRTPIGKYGGALSSVRADDLAAIPIASLRERQSQLDWAALDDVWMGCANQAGEDNRNVARMAVLLAGLPETIPGTTINRLCGSGLDAVGTAARAIRSGEIELALAGGVESMSRAPFVTAKATSPFDRSVSTFDTTIGWRFINPRLETQWGADTMPETAENVAEQFAVSREDQDSFALRSQQRAVAAQDAGVLREEIIDVSVPQRRGEPVLVSTDEQPRRQTSLEALAKLPTPFRAGGTVTAGNASSVNDGACAVLLASEQAVQTNGLTPLARVCGMASSALAPRIMGYGPFAATRKLLDKMSLKIDDIDVIELNEAFAAQALAVTRSLGLADDAEQVNPNGGAIALGHPLGMSGARLVTTACYELRRRGGRYAICTKCIGVGQGLALLLERA